MCVSSAGLGLPSGSESPMERCPPLGSSQLKAAATSCRHLASLSGSAPSNGRAPWAVAQAPLWLSERGKRVGDEGGCVCVRGRGL